MLSTYTCYNKNNILLMLSKYRKIKYCFQFYYLVLLMGATATLNDKQVVSLAVENVHICFFH